MTIIKDKKYRIISVEAERIVSTSPLRAFSLYKDEKPNTELFTGMLDYSLESEKLYEVWQESRLSRKMYFTVGSFKYTTVLINVSFTYVSAEPKYNCEELRRLLYCNGFDLEGVHYVRYKRSAGSSRSGNCLFIAEPLYKKMMKWSLSGLSFKENSRIDLASFEAYKSLSLSSIKNTVRIPKESILLVEDVKSVFRAKAAVTSVRGNTLFTEERDVEVQNTVWDGEALLDVSLFEETENAEKGMMLLRNRFFKTCAFNTNLSIFFADNGITEVSELCGYTLAEKVSDIKMIVTGSSIKYLKLADPRLGIGERFKLWLDSIDPIFGIVKTDKRTGFFGGRMVRTSYQLINTLGLNEDETSALLADTLSYFSRVRSEPIYMRNYINYTVSASDSDDFSDILENGEDCSFKIRSKAIYNMLSRNDDFAKTAFYKGFCSTVTTSFSKKIRNGRLLVRGTYATLFGNGLELLYAAIGKYRAGDEALALAGEDKIYTPRFPQGTELLGARSPHITMGNLLFASNVGDERIDRYFNLSREIVYVNAIGSNIQQRLNGCDYDSDTMLITDERIMVEAAKRNRELFTVPVCDITPEKRQYVYNAEDCAELDHKISQNKIGDIVNLSQRLNSLYWHKLSSGDTDDAELRALYLDICSLAVLSGMEIDKAKRNYTVNTASYLQTVTKKYSDSIGMYPEFFTLIKKKRPGKEKLPTLKYNTTMDYLYRQTMDFTSRLCKHSKTKKSMISFADTLKLRDPEPFRSGKNDARDFRAITDELMEKHMMIKHLFASMAGRDDDEIRIIREDINGIYQSSIELLSKKLCKLHLLYVFLRELDSGFAGCFDESENRAFAWFVFELLAVEPKHRLLATVMSESRSTPIHNLEIDEAGEEYIYVIPHTRKLAKNARIT